MAAPAKKMSKTSEKIIYVTRDIERALGMEPSEKYRIVTNKNPYSETIKKEYPEFVMLVESGSGIMDTGELLESATTASYLQTPNSYLLIFKNTNQIEELAAKNKWRLLNPSAELAEKIENKLTQTKILGEEIASLFPEHSIKKVKDIAWEKKPFVIQWAHSHTGDGTILVDSAKVLKDTQTKFPEREARVSEFIKGPSFTVNAVVASDIVDVSTPSFQITGMEPFTENAFSTVGNDWSATHTLLSEQEVSEVEAIATKVGEKLRELGWKGLFGADFVKDEEKNAMFLIEINARQPASTSYESELQSALRVHGVKGLTTFEAHLKALQGEKLGKDRIIKINDGAQILQRVTTKKKTVSDAAKESIAKAGYKLVSYENSGMNADLLRIQSPKGIMENDKKFNARGKEIETTLNN